MVDPQLQEVYPEPHLIAYKRQKNIKDFLIRAKVPPALSKNQKRIIPGMKQCIYKGRQCHACPYVKQTSEVKSNTFNWKINTPVNCGDSNIVYLIECNKDKCKMKYVGETDRTMRERFQEHKTYVNQKKSNKQTGEHFNTPKHTLGNMTITILDKVKVSNTLYRKKERII